MDENQTTDTPQAATDVNMVMNLEAMIKSHLSSIDRLQEEYEKFKGLLEDIFSNDPTFKKHTEEAKEAARIKSATKQQILKQPQAADLNEKVKTLKGELKDTQAALSDYLREFQRMSGINEIEGDDGEIREIVYVAKLVKKGGR